MKGFYMFEKLKPLLEGATLADPKEEFRTSKRFEKYRMSANALFIPAGFSWNYLPLKEITRFKKVTRLITSDNGVCPFSMEAPGIRIHFRGEEDDRPRRPHQVHQEQFLPHVRLRRHRSSGDGRRHAGRDPVRAR